MNIASALEILVNEHYRVTGNNETFRITLPDSLFNEFVDSFGKKNEGFVAMTYHTPNGTIEILCA